jgi:hypothetical protein
MVSLVWLQCKLAKDIETRCEGHRHFHVALKTANVIIVCAAASDSALNHVSKGVGLIMWVIKPVTGDKDFICNNIIVSLPSPVWMKSTFYQIHLLYFLFKRLSSIYMMTWLQRRWTDVESWQKHEFSLHQHFVETGSWAQATSI